ncbi:DNA polymerase III subunit beta [Amycolatopsis alkalitolerans]|uniref:DNA polymerase III subunit beta n=1 Tax=Amycolatopsis alkalitolerans TaxID=2547244 RepID=A0A5C4M7R0_9PSEU|nr:DNA polymerase III subunit beta [Amycolatopsis alkalitolerans]TNC27749.1 DNA polymerase III subunit beta [Amycolatopsis alkalitolerans]
MDLTATTAGLASAAAELTRLLPGRTLDPVLSGVLLTATAPGLVLAASDREHGLRLARQAIVHSEGAALVAARPLAETLRALEAEQVRLVVEGPRLAIRAPGARFALPLLDIELHPGVPEPPPAAGTVPGEELRTALAAVAGAVSREDALPIFTGIRMWTDGGRLTLLTTDRYRMARCVLPWPGAALDVLVPASALVDLARRLDGPVTVHTDADRFGLSWAGDAFSTALLAAPFPDDRVRGLLRTEVSGTVELAADTLAAAVRRATPYAGPRGTVTLTAWDGEVRVHSSDPGSGESEESVKAGVSGQHHTASYQARYLLDALRPFADRTVLMEQQESLRPTVFTGEAGQVELTHLVVPMRSPV